MKKQVINLKFIGDLGIENLSKGIFEFLKANNPIEPTIILVNHYDKRIIRKQQSYFGHLQFNNDNFHQHKITIEGITLQLEVSERMQPGEIEIH